MFFKKSRQSNVPREVNVPNPTEQNEIPSESQYDVMSDTETEARVDLRNETQQAKAARRKVRNKVRRKEIKVEEKRLAELGRASEGQVHNTNDLKAMTEEASLLLKSELEKELEAFRVE